MPNPYENLQPVNIGNAFMQSFDQGAAKRKDMQTQNALSQYALDPNNPEAMQGLAKYNPEMAIQLQQQKAELALKGLTQHKEQIQIGASILEAMPPRDQASWDAAKAQAKAHGVDVSQLPVAWDATAQQYVQGVIAINKHLNPDRENTPSAVREYEYRQGLPADQQPGFDRFRQSIRPQIFGSSEGGYNVFDLNGAMGGGQQGGQPQQPPSKEAYDALPPGTQYMAPDGSMRIKGGQTGSAPSGGFLQQQ